MKTYSEYVNNFMGAMSMLESRIKKKPRFVTFLKDALIMCGTNLIFQRLLLKPIQRIPQYILILQVSLSAGVFELVISWYDPGFLEIHSAVTSQSDATSDGVDQTRRYC